MLQSTLKVEHASYKYPPQESVGYSGATGQLYRFPLQNSYYLSDCCSFQGGKPAVGSIGPDILKI